MKVPESVGKALFIFGLIMVLFYITGGFILIFADYFAYIPKNIRVIFGIFFIAYGLFRAARVYQKLNSSNYEE